MTLDLRSVELFVRVATLGALGKAGEEFQLSATSTTQRIQALENALGAKLLTRTTRSVSLTSDGAIFLEHARKILDTVEGAKSSISAETGQVSGELRVTASASFGRSQIVPHVPEFLSRYPNVTLKLDLSDTLVDIVDQGYDLAIRVGVLTSSSLVARKLVENPRVLVASPDYLQRRGTPERPADLKTHDCIILGETRSWQLRDPTGGLHDIRVSGPFMTNFGEAITDIAVNGVGIGLKSLWDVHEHLDGGRLVRVLSDYDIEPQWKVWAVRPANALTPARVQAFTAFLENKFKRALI